MTEIETKRKEFEQEIGFLVNQKLEMFNLGVEMARKEFLDKIGDIYHDVVENDNSYYYEETKDELESIFKMLKQSLGEKEA